MFVHPDAKLNGFKLVKIPSAHDLMRQFGENRNLMHDGVNGEHYVPAGNPNNVDNLDMLEQSRQELNQEIAVREREARAKAQASAQSAASSSTDTAKTDE